MNSRSCEWARVALATTGNHTLFDMAFIEHKLRGTWRGSPFAVGERYRVLKAAPSYSGELAPGELLTFFGSTYGHYDGVSMYVFTSRFGEERTWALYDNEPIESWSSIFAAVTDVG